SLEASIEAAFQAIRYCGTDFHVVPSHCASYGSFLTCFYHFNDSRLLFLHLFCGFRELNCRERSASATINDSKKVSRQDIELGYRVKCRATSSDMQETTGAEPQTQSFCFQSSTVRYGGANGTYYTSSTTRRTGSDGVTFEVAKEADSSIKEASHRVSKGIHGKGHSLTRKLNSDGRVDMQAYKILEHEAEEKAQALKEIRETVDHRNHIDGSVKLI
ncbi:hypothetical protein S245_036401, partial [Arachis hypogaea]